MAGEIRDARPGDAAAIAAIWNHVIRETTATFTTEEKGEGALRTWLATQQAAGRPVLVLDDGGCVGFATWGRFRGGPGYAHVAEITVYLAEDAQGAGGGRRLLAALQERARTAGLEQLIAGISGENEAAIAFHRRCGFEEAGRIPGAGRKFGRLLDLVLMHKPL